MVRCIDCEKTIVVINEKGGLEGYVCEANPKLSSAFHFLEIPRNELSKKIDCNLFTPLISTRTLTENEMLARNKQISGNRHERKIQENKKPVQMETKKCNRCGKSMNKMNRFWVCFNCRKTVPVEFLK